MTFDSALREALRHASIREIEETFEALGPQLLMEDRPLGSAVPVTPGCGPDKSNGMAGAATGLPRRGGAFDPVTAPSFPWRPAWGGRVRSW